MKFWHILIDKGRRRQRPFYASNKKNPVYLIISTVDDCWSRHHFYSYHFCGKKKLPLFRLIEYFHLDDLFKENEYRLMLLHKQKKEIYRTRLIMNQTMNLCVSVLLSLISLLVCVTIPYVALEAPCEQLKDYSILYGIAKWVDKYIAMIDRIIIILCVLLVCVSVKTVWDAIKTTNISISPWLERGKYVLPSRRKKSLLLFQWRLSFISKVIFHHAVYIVIILKILKIVWLTTLSFKKSF